MKIMPPELAEWARLNQNQIKSITDLSKDDSHPQDNWCSSKCTAYNFDSIIKKYCQRKHKEIFCSVDAISIIGDVVNFIEFKNCVLNKKEITNIKRKIAESTRYFEKIVMDSCFFSMRDIETRFILVYGNNAYNGSDSYQNINRNIVNYAGRSNMIECKVKTVEDYCQALKYFDDVKILSSNEFISDISKYAYSIHDTDDLITSA